MTRPAPAPITLEQIGQQLKSARDAVGLSLGQISDRTKIPLNHLEALDSGRADDLPEPVYVSGFIKRYADCVGLDSQVLADQYKQVTDGIPNNGRFAFLKQAPKEQLAPVAAPVYMARGAMDKSAPNPFKMFTFYGIWILIVLGLVATLVTSLIQRNSETAMQDPSELSLKEMKSKLGSVPSMPTTVPTAPQTGTDNATDKNTPDHTDARVSLSASKRVWIEVKAVSTGDTVFTGSMERGDRKDFQDSQGLRVRVADGGNLTVEQDGKSSTFSEAGKKAERVFMAANQLAPADNPDEKTKPGATSTTTTPGAVVAKKPTTVKKPVAAAVKKHIEGSGSHRELPGETFNDVPYRY